MKVPFLDGALQRIIRDCIHAESIHAELIAMNNKHRDLGASDYLLATLPRRNFSIPVLPILPITMTSILESSARFIISSAGRPSITLLSIGTPAFFAISSIFFSSSLAAFNYRGL